MCFGGTQVDPYATAQAQNQVNANAIGTAARYNQINQVTPFGAQTYSGTPGQPDNTLTTTLDPQLQGIVSTLFGKGGDVANNLQAGNLDFSKLAGGPDVSADYAPITDTFNKGGAIQYDIGDAGAIQRGLSYDPTIQRGVNQNFDSLLGSSRDAAYRSQIQYLDPRFAREQQAMESQLAAQGIPLGSEAYKNAMAQFGETKNQAYQGAQDSATLTGNALQNQLFGQSLAGGQFSNQAQQQGYEQALGSGQFGNDAQAQYFGQLAARQAANNAAAGQDFSQNAAAAQFANDANMLKFGQTQALRNQGINEQQLAFNTPYNQLAALLNGQQLTNPTFSPTPQYAAAQGSPDLVGLAAGNAQNRSNILGSIFGGIGKVGAAAVGAA